MNLANTSASREEVSIPVTTDNFMDDANFTTKRQLNVVNTFIHVVDELDQRGMNTLIDSLMGMPGVIAAHFKPLRKHMLSITFHPKKTKALEIIKQLRNTGCTIRLIGC